MTSTARSASVFSLAMVVVATAAQANATFLTQSRSISSGTAFPAQSAPGFGDFDVNASGSFGTPFNPGAPLPYFEAARQRSTLRPDRIDVALFAETRYASGNPGFPTNTMFASTSFNVTFSIAQRVSARLIVGDLFNNAQGGGTQAILFISGGAPLVFGLPNQSFDLALQPGAYTLNLLATAGSLRGFAGTAGAQATLLIPAPGAAALLALAGLTGLRRRR